MPAVPAPHLLPPPIIQGGMGVAVSNWRLARAVSMAGQLGVVSGTAIDVVIARRLQDGDVGGHVRRALAAFPVPQIADRVLKTYLLAEGREPGQPYRPVPMMTLNPSRAVQELLVVANFCEVYLARQGHFGIVGINYLPKTEMPLPFACLGAMLAGVDVVLVGAGSPAEMPELLRVLALRGEVALPVRAQGTTSADATIAVQCDPRGLIGDGPPLHRPELFAVVASSRLASALVADPATRPDGLVVEAPSAGAEVDLAVLRGLGVPFWLAEGQASPDALVAALAVGAAGVQVGTAFAFSAESGLADPLKEYVVQAAAAGESVQVRTDWRASPTGLPFKVVAVAGTLSEPSVAAARPAVCDLGALRTPFKQDDGSIGYRCPAEPTASYVDKGGRLSHTEGRQCLCNALMAAGGLAQVRPHAYEEPPIVTSGSDFSTVAALARAYRHDLPYPAQAVIDYLTAGPLSAAVP